MRIKAPVYLSLLCVCDVTRGRTRWVRGSACRRVGPRLSVTTPLAFMTLAASLLLQDKKNKNRLLCFSSS